MACIYGCCLHPARFMVITRVLFSRLRVFGHSTLQTGPSLLSAASDVWRSVSIPAGGIHGPGEAGECRLSWRDLLLWSPDGESRGQGTGRKAHSQHKSVLSLRRRRLAVTRTLQMRNRTFVFVPNSQGSPAKFPSEFPSACCVSMLRIQRMF